MEQPKENEQPAPSTQRHSAEERERFVEQMMETAEKEELLRETPLTEEEKTRLQDFLRNVGIQAELQKFEGSLDLGDVIRRSFRLYTHGGSIDVDATPEPQATFQPQLGRGWVPAARSLPIPQFSMDFPPDGHHGHDQKGKPEKGLRIKVFNKDKKGSGSIPLKDVGGTDDSDLLFGENGKIYNVQGEPLTLKWKVVDKNGQPVEAGLDPNDFVFGEDGSVYDKDGNLQDYKWQIDTESGEPVSAKDLDAVVPQRHGVPFSQASQQQHPGMTGQGMPGQGMPGQGMPGQGIPGQGMPEERAGPHFGEHGKVYNTKGEPVTIKWKVVDKNGKPVDADLDPKDYVFGNNGEIYDKHGNLQDFKWQLETESGKPLTPEDQNSVLGPRGTNQYGSPPGTEHYRGPPGTDQYRGPPGTDQYRGPPGTDQYRGPPGTDQYRGPPGTDQYRGPPGTDQYRGPPGTGQQVGSSPGTQQIHGPHFGENGQVYNANNELVPMKWKIVDKNGQPVEAHLNPNDYVFGKNGEIYDKHGNLQDFKWQLESESGGPVSDKDLDAVLGERGPDGVRNLPDTGRFHGEPDKNGVHGPPGVDGIHGQPGTDGFRGQPGSEGFQGQPGSEGFRGQPGSEGFQGQPGSEGFRGQPGSEGYRGQPGSEGFQGQPGSEGFQGQPGSEGFQGQPGSEGYRGQPGSEGYQGQPGSEGFRGQPGSEGFRGQPGSEGFRGQPGSEGFRGQPGSEGFRGQPGSEGYQGQPGTDGFRGQPGSEGFRGQPGSEGFRGQPGSEGFRGYPTTGDFYGQPGTGGKPGTDGSRGQQVSSALQELAGKGFLGPPGSESGEGQASREEPEAWQDYSKAYPKALKIKGANRKKKDLNGKDMDRKDSKDSVDSLENDFMFGEDGKVFNGSGVAVSLQWQVIGKNGRPLIHAIDPNEYVFENDGAVYDLHGVRQDFTWQITNENGDVIELPTVIEESVPINNKSGVRFSTAFTIVGPDGNVIKPVSSGVHIVHSRGAFHLDTFGTEEEALVPVASGAEVVGPSGIPLLRVTESGKVLGPKGTPLNAGAKILDPRGKLLESKGYIKGPGGLPMFLIQTGHRRGSKIVDNRGDTIVQNETGTMILDKNGNMLMMFDLGGQITNSKSNFTQVGQIGTKNDLELYDYYVMDIGGHDMVDSHIQRRVQKLINKYVAPPASPIKSVDPDDPYRHFSTHRGGKKSEKRTPGFYDFPQCLEGTEWQEFLNKGPKERREDVADGKSANKERGPQSGDKTHGEDYLSVLSDEEEGEGAENEDDAWEKLRQSGYIDKVDPNDPISIAKKKAISSLNKFKLHPIKHQHWNLKKALDGSRPITRQEVAFHCENGDILLIRYNKVINAMPIVMTHVNEHQNKILPLINMKGGDVSHWFNPITGEPRTEIDLRTGKKILSTPNGAYYGLGPFQQKLLDEEEALLSRASSANSAEDNPVKLEEEIAKDYDSFKTLNFVENDVSGFAPQYHTPIFREQEYAGEGDDGLYVDSQLFEDQNYHRMSEEMGEHDEEEIGEFDKEPTGMNDTGEFTVIKKNRDSVESPESKTSFIMESTGFRSPDLRKSNSSGGSLPLISPSVMINKSPPESTDDVSKQEKLSDESLHKELSMSQTQIEESLQDAEEEHNEKKISDENMGQAEQERHQSIPKEKTTEESNVDEKSHSSPPASGASSPRKSNVSKSQLPKLETGEEEEEEDDDVFIGEELGEYELEDEGNHSRGSGESFRSKDFSKASLATSSEFDAAFSTIPMMGSPHSMISEVPSMFSKSTADTTAQASTVFDNRKPEHGEEGKWSSVDIHYEEQWWIEPKYVCGYVPNKSLRIKIINSVSYDEKTLVISKEYTINDIMRYYLPYNHNAMAYRWEDMYGNVLHPDKTVVDNGLVDLTFADDNGFNCYPVIILVFMDGFENEPTISLNPKLLASQMVVPEICRNY